MRSKAAGTTEVANLVRRWYNASGRRGNNPQGREGTAMPIVGTPSNRETVEKYWQSMNARDWAVLAKLLSRGVATY